MSVTDKVLYTIKYVKDIYVLINVMKNSMWVFWYPI